MDLINNSINSINQYETQYNQKKEIKTSFMPKIKRSSVEKNFNKKMSPNLTKYLFDFFSKEELYELGKINLYFMNNLIDYNDQRWQEKIRKLKATYNFTIVDDSLKQAKINKSKYKFPSENGKEVNYYQFDIDGDKYISIARTFNWAHKNNEIYWREEKLPNSYEEDQGVPYLISVCWIDTNFSFLHVKPGNYKLYVNETFNIDKNFEEKVKLKVTIGGNKVIYEVIFPSQQIFDNNSNTRQNCCLNEDFICYIKKEDFDDVQKDENGDCKVRVDFNHTDDFWKGGWFIDGGCLKEITQKEMDEEIEKINKKKKVEEKKKKFKGYEEDEKDNNI